MRFMTAGESHGKGLTVMIDGFPAGVPIDFDAINQDLARRQQGYGRGGRMIIEKDTVEPLAGIRFKKSTGAPIVLFIENKDAKNWLEVMDPYGEPNEASEAKKFIHPRPGHADLAAHYKYGMTDLRDSLERSSARETAARVAAGAIAKCFLKQHGIQIFSHVVKLGGIAIPASDLPKTYAEIYERAESNDLRCAGKDETLQQIRDLIDATRKAGSTLGGDIETVALNVPPGLGSHTQWDRKLDGKIAQAIMSIQAVKSVSIGAGDIGGEGTGHDFHDAICLTEDKIIRPTNRAGGLEGGITNGEPVIVKAVMKPISTLLKPLSSVNLETMQEEPAHFERSDVTAVPACGVVCEAMLAITLTQAWLERFGERSD